MTDTNQRQSNSALWIGLFFMVLGILSYFLYGSKIPQAVVPWINLALPAVGVVFLLAGLRRAFGRPPRYGGKIWGSIVTVLSVLMFALAVWGNFHSRDVPRSGSAPQVGQRMPDFTLQDSMGHPVSLAQLFSTSDAGAIPPKAVLLIFYRGYW